MNIDEKIKELEKQINELKAEKENQGKRWRAERDISYYYIASCCNVELSRDDYGSSDDARWELGNYFETKEECLRHKQNLITYQQLKDIALRLNNGRKIDWNNGSQDKYYIYFDYIENEFGLTFANSMRSLSGIYCLDEKYLDIAIDEIGEEKLRQLLEWGI